MSDTTPVHPTEEPPSAASSAPRGTRRRTPFGHAVADHVARLQRLSNADVAGAVRTMAILRRAATSHPGSIPDVWEDTIALAPEDSWRPQDGTPSTSELAAHHAVTLFAMHRQGRVGLAHVPGVGPGRALARLARKRGDSAGDKGVRRRFDAMLTAPTPEESVRHLRGLVQLLRAEDIGLDYGLLAEDLRDLWTPATRDRARLRWARQYSGLPPSSSISNDDGGDERTSGPSTPPIDSTPEETA